MAAREGKRLNQVTEEALSEHLARKSSESPSLVARTKGNLSISKDELDRILREEPGPFDL
jgi:undecaprenyl pyrophosphate synthase